MQIGRVKVKGLLWIVLFVCIAGCFASGCASYNVQTQRISQSYELGNIQAAAAQISAEADKRGEGKDAVVWRLEQGAVLRAASKIEESNQAFDKAEELINKFEEKAKIKVSREALAAVTNLTTLPYEGFAYDKIMMNTYKALNYIELGDYEMARVEFLRAHERQKDALQINAKRIERAQEEGEEKDLSVDMDKIGNDTRFKNQFANVYGNLDQYKSYADYVNPVSVYLDGIFFMTQGVGNSDFEHSRKSFERVIGMVGENRYIQEDLETLQKIITAQQIPATTYVFYETGQAPEREQIRIDLPLFLITPGLPYVGAAFPRLKFRDNYVSVLNVSYGGITEPTLLLSNMDHVVAREFKNELPVVITKTLIASAVKAAVTYGASKAASKKSDTAGFATLLAGAIYQAATNQADLRTWTSLPKEFQFCRFCTPEDRKIELETPFSGYKLPVDINEGLVNVVWVKSITRGSPLLVRQFTLLKDDKRGIVSPETTIPEPIGLEGTFESDESAQMVQTETSKPDEPVQMPQQESLQSEEGSRGNKPEVATEQLNQPLQSETSQSEQTVQIPQLELMKAEESMQLDDSNNILASVNDENIYQKDVGKIFQRFADQVSKEEVDTVKKQILDGLISQKLLMQFIRDNKIEVSQVDIDAELNKVRKDSELKGQTLEQALESQGSSIEDIKRDIKISLSLEKYLSKDFDNQMIEQKDRQDMLNKKVQLLIKQLREEANIYIKQ